MKIQESSESFGKSWRREIFPQPKVQKTVESCMDFPFLNRTDGGKDPLPSRRRIVQSFPRAKQKRERKMVGVIPYFS